MPVLSEWRSCSVGRRALVVGPDPNYWSCSAYSRWLAALRTRSSYPTCTSWWRIFQRGTLDFTLTKPADAQTLVSVRQVSIWQSVDILAGLIVLIVALIQLGDSSDGISRALSLVMLLLLGNWTIYCFWLILASSAFWFIRVGEMQELFQGLFRSGQYPVGIYPRWMRFGLTFLVPIGFAVTVPSEAATNRLSGTTVIVALVAAAVFGIGSRWIWRTGLRHYSGASA